ncbi:MAG: hypothetical protein JNK92_10415, partial [Dechloromonas sp.]|nr:hypothetical protein [Dechloromonas sp.]
MSTIKILKQPPTPVPAGLEGIAADTWRSIVDSLPANYLRPGDLPLLRAYCVAVATWEEAIVLLSIDGNIIDNKVHPARRLADE